MKLQYVPLEWVNQVWPSVESFIAEAAQFGDDYTVEQIRVYVTQGLWTLCVLTDETGIQGAGTINFFNRPNARVAFVTSVSGKFITTPEVFEQLKTLVMSKGATEIEGAARESIARLWRQNFGFEEKYRIVGVKLC